MDPSLRILTTLAFSLAIVLVHAQNLVPNPSFEIIEDCNLQLSTAAIDWGRATLNGTPDLFNECSEDATFRVPNIFLGCDTLPAYTGEGYAGMAVYGIREYLQAELTSSPPAGAMVYLSFQVSPMTLCIPSLSRYTDGIGMAFSDTAVFEDLPTSGANPLTHPTALENKGSVIKGSGSWTAVTGCFEARGDERFVIIGNFLSDDSTLIEAPAPWTVSQNYFYVDEIVVEPFDPLPDTTFLCVDQTVLRSSFTTSRLNWSTGELGDSIIVSEPGWYYAWIEAGNCILTDSTLLVEGAPPDMQTIVDSLCPGETIELSAPVIGTYDWSTGSMENSILVDKTGRYSVTITNACDQFEMRYDIINGKCDCNIYVPNIFSPNGDGINDELKFEMACRVNFEFEYFRVFNRWGSQVFETTDPNSFWDGRAKGAGEMAGTYVWQLIYSIQSERGMDRRVVYGETVAIQ